MIRRTAVPGQAARAPASEPRPAERAAPEGRRLRADAAWIAVLFLAALGSNFFFRGMVVDDSTLAWEWADNFLGRRPIAAANVPEDLPPLYPFLLYVSFRIMGHDLVALHLVPLLAALANPILAYFLFRDLFSSRKWGGVGALLFLAWPSGIFFYNQALAEPVTLSIVLATLLAYTRERLWSFLFLAALALVSAYDSALLCLGLAADAVLRCRRSPFHARLALLVAAAALLGGLGMLADKNGLHTGLVPWYRLETQLFQRFGESEVPFSFEKADLIARLWFAYLLVPVVLAGAGADLWRRRRIWGSLPIALYLCYELALTPTFLPMLGVTLRHLTLVVPCAVLLAVACLEAVASGWSRRGKWTRRLAATYAVVAVAAVVLVQAKHAYYHTGIQISTNPVEIAAQNRELPFYVHSSPRLWREDRYFFSRTLPSRSGGWDEVVLDLDGVVRDGCQTRGQPVPDGPVRKVELLILRGELDLGWMRLEDSRTPGRSTEIPLEDWRAVSHGGEIEVVRPGAGHPHLAVRPSEGFLFGVAYPLDRTFAAEGTGDRLRLAVRGSGRFVLNAVVRTEGGERLFLAFSPTFPTIIKNPEQIDRLVVKCMNDTVHWKCLGFFRPEGLRTVGPLLEYDYVYYRTGELEEEESFPRHTLALSGISVDEEKKYLGPGRGAEGEILYDFAFGQPLGSVALAAFVSHVAPGDRARIELAVEDGPWQELGEISGFLGRSHWGQELVEPVRGRTRFRLRISLAASGWFPESARRLAPMGLRDLAVGVRYLRPEGGGE